MKKNKLKDGQVIEIVKPFFMDIQFSCALAFMYMCMSQHNITFGIVSIFFGWQAGWSMRFEKYRNEENN